MRLTLAATILALPIAASAQTPSVQPPPLVPYEGPVFTTPLAMWTVTPHVPYRGAPFYVRIFNASVPNGPLLWCSRYVAPGATQPAPAPTTGGSFSIAPGASEQFTSPNYVPAGPTWCVSDGTGTAQVTVEVY